MRTVHTVRELRAMLRARRERGQKVALVPTMGNLHRGHIELVHNARSQGDVVVTSIFVNPMQFGKSEDLDAYPRTLTADQKALEDAGNDMIFAPAVREVYPAGMGDQTRITVPGLTEHHCGASRPGHFAGVATVVTMLFNIVQPDVAVFGEKDFQQLAVIRKLVRDLFIPVKVVGMPTVRENDGLAMSSRNGFLSPEERARAPLLYRLLSETVEAIAAGDTDFPALSAKANQYLKENGFQPDYFNIANSETLQPADPADTGITVLAAARLGQTRLIDNISLERS
jgi:pantoate--beta-alanine ligase